VTGASRGIGAALAVRLAAEGAQVAITARTLRASDPAAAGSNGAAGSLEETAERLREFGGGVVCIEADLALPDARAGIVREAVDALGGPIDVLVNNAAAGIYRPLEKTSLAHRQKMLEINLNAPIDLMQAVAPGMRELGHGWIVNVSSETTRHAEGPPFEGGPLLQILSFYGATKAALSRVTNGFALETYGSGIRVNTVQPRVAVATEGAVAKGVDDIRPDQFESVEAMVEATLALCTCEVERTGGVYVSLDLLALLQREVRGLDGSAPAPVSVLSS